MFVEEGRVAKAPLPPRNTDEQEVELSHLQQGQAGNQQGRRHPRSTGDEGGSEVVQLAASWLQHGPRGCYQFSETGQGSSHGE